MIEQEEYLNDLEDCFMANQEFLPKMVILDKAATTKEAAQHIAMANGEDDVSILSNLMQHETRQEMKSPLNPDKHHGPKHSLQ